MHDPTLNLVHYGVCKYQFHRCAQHSQRHQGTRNRKIPASRIRTGMQPSGYFQLGRLQSF
ncbi:MAG: hypothetical protein QOH35_1932 [Acidobacteriaceae bacterium]|jgi:hypothetical protein|nr:hypothetical protein [Acidobacteriaceae bacterium]MEA2540566.1 hypothetical protein [Acidobacteriaceae bacterium]